MNIFPGPLKKEMNQTDPLDDRIKEILEEFQIITHHKFHTYRDDKSASEMIEDLAAVKAAINAEIAKAVREDRERIRLLLVEYGVVSSQIFNPTTEELRSLWHDIAQLEQPHD